MDVGSFQTTKTVNPILVLGIIGIGVAAYFGITSLGKKGSEIPNPDRAGQAQASAPTGAAAGLDSSGNPVGGGTPSSPTDPCTVEQKDSISSQSKFDAWKASINNGLGTATQTDLNSRGAAITSMSRCLQALTTIASSSATRGATLGQVQEDLRAAIEQTKSDIQVAADRALLTANPEYTRSFYDGWFPMDRPFRKNTVAILIGAALFFVCMSFLSILSFLRFDTRILVPSFGGVGTPLRDQARQPLFLFVLSLLAVVGGLAAWGFTR
jgi:hypothetical protein